jgi:hypothetical protein
MIIFVSFALASLSSVADAQVNSLAPDVEIILSDGRPLINGTVIGSREIEIVCLVLDSLIGLHSVEYSFDNGYFKDTNSQGDLHRTAISLSGVEEGAHTLTVRATNNASLTTEESVDFSIDLSAPSPASPSIVWDTLGAVIALSGFLSATVLILSDKMKQGKPPSEDKMTLDPQRPIL